MISQMTKGDHNLDRYKVPFLFFEIMNIAIFFPHFKLSVFKIFTCDVIGPKNTILNRSEISEVCC